MTNLFTVSFTCMVCYRLAKASALTALSVSSWPRWYTKFDIQSKRALSEVCPCTLPARESYLLYRRQRAWDAVQGTPVVWVAGDGNPAYNLQFLCSMDIRMFEKEANCVTRQIGAETIIVPVRASAAHLRAVYTLNESATEIWQRIDGQTSVERIVNAFCSLYDVSPSEAEQDVAEFLSVLSSAGLIRAQEDPSAPAA